MYPHPIRTGFGGGIRAPTAVVGERDVDERRRTVGRKGIRIEEQFALSRERALAPQRRLVLQAVVEEIVVIVAVPLGRALDRVLTWNYYMLPMWYMGEDRLARWDKFSVPAVRPVYSLGFDTWWYDVNKAARLPAERR